MGEGSPDWRTSGALSRNLTFEMANLDMAGSLAAGGRQVAQEKLESFWSEGRNDALACLSVRSGFDLLLQSFALPAGSEVLFSAVTIQDMPKIAEAHGLV